MAEVINLRNIRKRTKRQEREKQADAKRLIHGLPKRIRNLEADKRAKAIRDLEQHRIDRGDDR